MLQVVKSSFYKVLFSQNIFSFILYSFLISKAYDYAPVFYHALTNRFVKTTEDVKLFGRFELPLAQCMFFRNTRASCLIHKELACDYEDCLKKNLRDLYDLIRAAQNEILICCYTFRFHDLAEVIMEARDRNVIVRVVTNFDSATSEDSAMQSFRKKGITIKMMESTYIFHHKFIILDGTVLINGSTNFTDQGILNNIDSLLVTSDPFFIEKYTEEFNFLWKNFMLTY